MNKTMSPDPNRQNYGSAVPAVGHPFYIVTPPYTRLSAGITVLHLLCHYLNRCGETAYIVHYPPERDESRFLPAYAGLQRSPEHPGGFIAPLITQSVIDFYDKRRITPIVIYPEVFDNPLNAKFFARYILNYPGLLAPKFEQDANYTIAYTKILKDATSASDVLFIPTCDLDFFNRSGEWDERSGTCFYAGKLKKVMGEQPENVPSGSIEILHSQDMSREEVRDIFWRSELFYCYENTALSTEALLCGCPTVYVKNKHFSGEGLASIELGDSGSCKNDEVGGIDRAKRTVGAFGDVISSYINRAPETISYLAQRMKAAAATQEYRGTIDYPFEPKMVFFDKLALETVGFGKNTIIPSVEDAGSRPETAAGLENIASEITQKIEQKLVSAVSGRIDERLETLRSLSHGPSPVPSIEHYQNHIRDLEAAMAAVRKSTSWRLTAPLRGLRSLFLKPRA